MSRKNKPTTKDMYWFAHGGIETTPDKYTTQRSAGDGEDENDSNSPAWKNLDRRGIHEDIKTSFTDGSNSSGPPSLERDDKLHSVEKRMAVEERKRQLWEAEQERNEAVIRKHMEREAALEARRNAQRSNIAFAFGSSVPRYVEALQVNQNVESDNMSRSFTAGGLSHKGDDLMTKSMTASISAPRGRRKNDLMPTVPYDRTSTPRVATSSSSRRRSVSMTRLDQLAQPRRHYVEATKANSTTSSGTSSMLKDVCSPNRPLSSASEHSGGRVSGNVTRRVRSSPRKPRPVSIAGTIPDQKLLNNSKSSEIKTAPIKRNYLSNKKTTENTEVKKASTSTFKASTPGIKNSTPNVKSSTPKSVEKAKSTEKVKSARTPTAPVKASTPKPTPPKQITSKPKKLDTKMDGKANTSGNTTPKTQSTKNLASSKKKTENVTVVPVANEVKDKSNEDDNGSNPQLDSDAAAAAENEKNNKRIISEEEAKAALAEKRRLAREQAEREAELERQRQEELKRLEEERLRQEEEEQRKLEEEHLRLLEEHRRQEEEKLRKAIEDQELKEEEERVKRDEELRLKAEQERKAKEEAEKLRLELEVKLRKEEEERAERKKRLEKIMSRTRGKSSGTSPSGSVSGSDHLDSGENQQENLSSGANSLESNEAIESSIEPVSSDEGMAKMEVSSGGNSLEANLTYEFGSNDVSLNSNDLMLPGSETASQDGSMIVVADHVDSHEKCVDNTDGAMTGVESHVQKENVMSEEEEISHASNAINDHSTQDTNDNDGIDQSNAYMLNINDQGTEHALLEPSHLQEKSESCFEEKDIVITDSSELLKSDEIDSNNCVTDIIPTESNASFQSPECSEIKSDESHYQEMNAETFAVSTEKSEASVVNQNESLFNKIEDSANINSKEDHLGFSEYNFGHDVSVDTCSEKLFSGDATQSEKEHFTDLYKQEDNSKFFQNQDMFSGSENLVAAEDTRINEGSNQNQDLLKANQNPFSDEYEFSSSTIGEIDAKENPIDIVEEKNLNQNHELPEQLCDWSEENSISKSNNCEEANNLKEESVVHSESIPTPSTQEGHEVTVDEKITGHNFSHAENTHSSFLMKNGDVEDDESEACIKSEPEKISGDDLFIAKSVSEQSMLPEVGDHDFQESKYIESEQARDFQTQNVHNSSEFPNDDLNNITLIKEKDSENLIGIISSIDNDQISNSFCEQLTNNFECASVTESEESSLDSNLSQVIATEEHEKTGFNYVENNSFVESNSIHVGNNILDHSDNPFKTECSVSNSNLPQTGVNLFTSSEVYSNGHSVESSQTTSNKYSEFHDYMQLDGNNILSVDHSKNNMFENVDAIDYGKVSPDSFLDKGSSKQISGNPFLMKDDQKQVLMTSDFLN